MNTTPEQLRAAADIIENGWDWDFKGKLPSQEWVPCTGDLAVLECLKQGLSIRRRPLDFAPIPDGAERHNPDGLTPEQVGEGWRLCVVGELQQEGYEYWRPSAEKWATGGSFNVVASFANSEVSVRVPLSTPYPDGSRVVDGRLVKPWVPRFKVGDRVKVIAFGRIDTITSIGATWYFTERHGSKHESELEPAPWTLTRHIPGFRPLRDGEEWHREDWTEEMLPEGWRPLLLNERVVGGMGNDEYFIISGRFHYQTTSVGRKAESGDSFWRTRRPLPEPAPEPAKVPLGPEDWMKDGPWWIRVDKSDKQPAMVIGVGVASINIGTQRVPCFKAAMTWERSNDGITWTPCWKIKEGNV